MKKDNLFSFVETGFLTDDFSKELGEEVLVYKKAVQDKKGTKNIYGENDVELPFGRQRLIALLGYYLQGKILEWDLEYILNYIELNFEVIDDKLEEVIFSLSDPYLNFPINTENVKESYSFLNDKVNVLKLKDDKGKVLREDYRSIFSDTLS